MLDKEDRIFLGLLQDDFPVSPRPYAVIGRRLRMSEPAVLRKVREFLANRIIRYIGAVPDTKKIGFKSGLVAFALPRSRIKEVSRIINGYPEVTHNYLRDDEYNMWFTVSAGTDRRRIGLISRIRREAGVYKWLDLPTVKVFKIDARFPLGNSLFNGRKAAEQKSKTAQAPRKPLSKRILAEICCALDCSARPFLSVSRSMGCTENDVAKFLSGAMQQGLVRRFGAILDHYKIGLGANALVAWQVRKSDIDEAAKAMAAVANVSHCYLRRTRACWPYNIYTMIHAADRRQCRAILKLILQQLGNTIVSTRVLFTVRELKKTRFNSNYAERIYGRTKEIQTCFRKAACSL